MGDRIITPVSKVSKVRKAKLNLYKSKTMKSLYFNELISRSNPKYHKEYQNTNDTDGMVSNPQTKDFQHHIIDTFC
jgi:hypothetical protein